MTISDQEHRGSASGSIWGQVLFRATALPPSPTTAILGGTPPWPMMASTIWSPSPNRMAEHRGQVLFRAPRASGSGLVSRTGARSCFGASGHRGQGSGLVSRYCLTAIAYHGHPRWHTTLTYDGLDHLVTITERDGQDIQTQHLLWCGEAICGLTDDKGQLFTRLFQQGEWHQGQVLYYAKDHLGSIRDVLGTLPPEGELIHLASYDYGPYGERLDEGRGRRLGSGGAGLGQSARPDEQAMGGGAVPDVSASPEPQDKRHAAIQSTLGYAGMFYHARSGLYLTHYRAYDPRLGRWLSRDPIWEAGGVNLYGYVGGDPVAGVDPLGLFNPLLIPVMEVGAEVGAEAGLPLGPLGLAGGALVGAGLAAAVGSSIGGPQQANPPNPNGPASLPVPPPNSNNAATGTGAGAAANSGAGASNGGQNCSHDEDCEMNLNNEIRLCGSVAGARYGKQGFAICRRSAMQRYAECLRFGINGIRTPLHGVDTPL